MLIFLLVLLIDSCKSYLENNSMKIIPSSKMYNIIIVSFLKEILFTIVKRYEVHAKPCKESWRTLYRKCGNESEKIITHNLEKFVFVSQAKMWLYFHESTVWKKKIGNVIFNKFMYLQRLQMHPYSWFNEELNQNSILIDIYRIIFILL